MLKAAKLIVWDESPCQHRYCFECVDRLLQDFCSSPEPFGGITLLFAGDFRQTLPVIPRASMGQSAAASIQYTSFWENIHHLYLTENLRKQTSNLDSTAHERASSFAHWIIRVGDGDPALTVVDNYISIPTGYMVQPQTLSALLSCVYSGLSTRANDWSEFFAARAILAPHNETVDMVNSQMLERIPGESVNFLSEDSAEDDDNEVYPVEFLNSLTSASLPPHKLEIKIGTPVMVIRNIAPRDGVCNGTRLIVTAIGRRVIEGKILIGDFAGHRVFIPRIVFTTGQDEALPVSLRRKQFPLRLAFAMTINKAQGQSL